MVASRVRMVVNSAASNSGVEQQKSNSKSREQYEASTALPGERGPQTANKAGRMSSMTHLYSNGSYANVDLPQSGINEDPYELRS